MSVSDHSVIERVSRALVILLTDGLQEISIDETAGINVELLSPADLPAPNAHLTVYLYRITRNGDVSNRSAYVEPDGTRRQPPLALDLSYLLTVPPTSTEPDSDDTYEQHRVLGQAIRVLQDNPVLSGVQVGEDVRITMHTEAMDEVLDVWNTFADTPYQPSVSYLVSPVLVAPARNDPTTPVTDWYVEEYVRAGADDADAEGSDP
ncbi:Protein of unknown function [Halogranum amylolyticum]|uniref:Pvc16 N-terminal domain-containing protein n=1 Tax=Halogranum amylolyticum TaxID=660520 RepID=A0A1H8WFR3_9EURY|nr:DUF4255 domain-containing protein [Halogranum amylolyticum]SEP26429.1 Protein of unknown function [Halogranum amylolyticum]